jgi:UDP-glucose 4-epimerase
MKILVTGAAGFIGSNLLDRLLDEGHTVVAVDDLSTGRSANIAHHADNPRFDLVQSDVALPETFAALPGDIDLIVHLAAKKIPRYGKALETLTVNYEGTRATLEFARRLGCKCVLASTSDVYGRNPDLPFSEAHSDSVIGSSKSARWAYAVSKLFDEHLALAYQEEYGFPVTLLRFFGSYGPRQILGWRGGPQSVFIDAVLRGEPMTIHGDGLQTRTFTYIADTVDGTYRAMMSPDADGEILNIGGTGEVTILDLAKRIKKLSGTPGELELEFVPYESFTGKPYQDVMRRVPDVKLAEHLLGFRAETPLDAGLLATIEWQREASR